jgi:hypothetical protein
MILLRAFTWRAQLRKFLAGKGRIGNKWYLCLVTWSSDRLFLTFADVEVILEETGLGEH